MQKSKISVLLPLLMFSVASLSGCSNSASGRVIRVLNCEDYIYEYDESFAEDEMDERDMMDQFVDYWEELTGEKISYVYDTFDTNETMFNELKTGKTTYDVIVTSDYMIQKLIANDMVRPFSDENIDSLWSNISPFLTEKFENIFAESKSTKENNCVYDYSIPYMWGTVGVMYNPNFYQNKKGIDEDSIHELMEDWDSLYGETLKDTFSIKDSVRDTYAVSIVHTFRDYISTLSSNKDITSVFNQYDEETMKAVKADMLKLKENAFGFECDSGKTDMTTQKIGANMCWSGDATWAITEARDLKDPIDLYYSIPTSYNGEENKSSSNIWFDGMCMPESDKLDQELAEAFIEFMSCPENAMQNCYAVGYTPGVAGDAMLDYIYDCYDVRGEVGGELDPELIEGVDYVKYDLTYFYEDSFEEYENTDAILYADIDYVDRELTAQYPSSEILDRLAIMNDFGDEGNVRLLDMWESVRTNPLPMWAVIIFIIEGILALALIGFVIYRKVIRRKLRKNR